MRLLCHRVIKDTAVRLSQQGLNIIFSWLWHAVRAGVGGSRIAALTEYVDTAGSSGLRELELARGATEQPTLYVPVT